MLRDAERVPDAAGVKLTEIVQLPPAATLVPHVLDCLISDALVPVTQILVIVRAAVPAFESVIVWAALVVPRFWFPNVTLRGFSEACATPTPIPLRAAV